MAKISQLLQLADDAIDGEETVPVVKDGSMARARVSRLGKVAATEARAEADRATAVAEFAIAGSAATVATKAEAEAGLANIVDGDFVQIMRDETRDDLRTVYRKENGALVFHIYLGVRELFPSVSILQEARIPAVVSVAMIAGYEAPGDAGSPWLVRRLAAKPAHDFAYQSADGTWWEPIEGQLDPRWIGAKPDGSVDAQPAFAATGYAARVLKRHIKMAGRYLLGSSWIIGSRDGARATGQCDDLVVHAVGPVYLESIKPLGNECHFEWYRGRRCGFTGTFVYDMTGISSTEGTAGSQFFFNSCADLVQCGNLERIKLDDGPAYQGGGLLALKGVANDNPTRRGSFGRVSNNVPTVLSTSSAVNLNRTRGITIDHVYAHGTSEGIDWAGCADIVINLLETLNVLQEAFDHGSSFGIVIHKIIAIGGRRVGTVKTEAADGGGTPLLAAVTGSDMIWIGQLIARNFTDNIMVMGGGGTTNHTLDDIVIGYIDAQSSVVSDPLNSLFKVTNGDGANLGGFLTIGGGKVTVNGGILFDLAEIPRGLDVQNLVSNAPVFIRNGQSTFFKRSKVSIRRCTNNGGSVLLNGLFGVTWKDNETYGARVYFKNCHGMRDTDNLYEGPVKDGAGVPTNSELLKVEFDASTPTSHRDYQMRGSVLRNGNGPSMVLGGILTGHVMDGIKLIDVEQIDNRATPLMTGMALSSASWSGRNVMRGCTSRGLSAPGVTILPGTYSVNEGNRLSPYGNMRTLSLNQNYETVDALRVGDSPNRIVHDAALTANRAIGLSKANTSTGDTFRIYVTGAHGFELVVKDKEQFGVEIGRLASGQTGEFMYLGSNWKKVA